MPKDNDGKGMEMNATSVGIIVLLLSAGTIGTILVGQQLGWWTLTPPPTTTPDLDFSLDIIDGMMGDSLPKGDFNYTLYGTDDLTDWLEFEVIETGTSLSNIGESDFDDEDEEFNFYIVNYEGSVDHDDDLYGEDYDWGARAYYSRWATIDPVGDNVLVGYQTPSDADFLVVNTESFAYINLTSANITTATNITIITGSNSTQEDAIYVAGDNYENEDDDFPTLRIQFNTTVSMTDFSLQSASKLRSNSTTILYRFSSLGAVPTAMEGKWSNNAEDIEIVNIDLLFGDTQISA